MIKRLIPMILFLGVLSCQQDSNTKKEFEVKSLENADKKDVERKYPENLEKIFKAHGGYDTWKNYRTLSYDINKGETKEVHVVDLLRRKDKIGIGAVTIGFDGAKVWVNDSEGDYEGDAVFYHNLMFYFYAMPFVLGDNGIIYGETENLEVDGQSYPGISITYNSGVGTSYKDEYYLHYDPDTYQMAWLGYTVTYRSGEDSDNIKWIRYDDWTKVGKVLLPNSISWYNYEGRTIKDKRNTVYFENMEVSVGSKPDDFYKKPKNGVFVKGKTQN